MSRAAEKRESARQQFIWTTISHVDAMAKEIAADPQFLAVDQEELLWRAVQRLLKGLRAPEEKVSE